MLKFWHGHDILVEILLDLGNYSLYCLIFLIFYRKKIINSSYCLLLCILMLTPFLFNNTYVPWMMNPDQSRYFQSAYNFRKDLNFLGFLEMRNLPDVKTSFASYIFAFSPILNIETFKSIGFFNRFVFLSSITYFIKKKKFSSLIFLILILSPSLTYFTSVSLRETLVLLFMLWTIYFYLDGKKILFIISISFVTIVKIQNLLIVLFFIFANEFIKFKNKKKFIAFTIIILTPIFLLYGQNILDQLNFIREGLFKEAYGSYRGLSSENTYYDLEFNFELILTTVLSLSTFSFSPILDISSMFKLTILIETFILYFILVKGYLSSKTKLVSNLWAVTLLFSFLIYSLVLFNDGTIHRYRVSLIFFSLIGYNLHINFLKKKYG